MAPIIDIVRHGESRHNVEKNGDQLRDPSLTAKGLQQCEHLREVYPYMDQATHIISSPMRRTIYTSKIGFSPLVSSGKRIVLLPQLQESSARPSDTGSPHEDLEAEFGDCIDTVHLYEGWWHKEASSFYGHDPVKIAERARVARLYIRDVARSAGENDHIVVVTHRSFVQLLIQGATPFRNAEFRSCRFVDLDGDDDQAVLVELS
ncbi:histidine phosphatase superfamily [Xylaria nigripes]|nr:histidine phosphatase superfamily [Xylaria nigripes]